MSVAVASPTSSLNQVNVKMKDVSINDNAVDKNSDKTEEDLYKELKGLQKKLEFLDIKTTHNLINEHLEGKQNRRLLIWSLLNIEIWLDIAGTGKWQIK